MTQLVFIQLLNGVQYGILLFLLAAGLTLVFGIMSFVNLAHGVVYMLGAYFAATVFNYSGSFVLAIVAAIVGCALTGVILERLALSKLYGKGHLDHVLATFGLILFFNELVRMIWGTRPYLTMIPEELTGAVGLLGFHYPLYRLVIILAGLLVAAGCYWLIHRTRLGMLIRAGSVNPVMVRTLGVNINFLNALLFALGAALAGFAGAMVGPIVSVQSGMGASVLITTLVVIIIGGIGSIRGAFYAALIVGVVDTMGRSLLPLLLFEILPRPVADATGPPLASMLIYLLMAIVLVIRPQGLFPVKGA